MFSQISRHRTVARVIVVFSALAFASCASTPAEQDGHRGGESPMASRIDLVRPDAPELADRGDYEVGVRTISLSNPDQLDVVSLVAGEDDPRYDRELVVETWYPAQTDGAGPSIYDVTARDGSDVQLVGTAVRSAEVHAGDGPHPLVIISHGYPGNRYLLSHLGEFLASHGYIVASIDHLESTYSDQGEFGSTLRNRALDQLFVLDEIARISGGEAPRVAAAHDADVADPQFLEGLVDADRTAIVGYSMGGYGALNASGAGLSDATLELGFAPEAVFEGRLASHPEYSDSLDPRVQAVVSIAPWGMQLGLWDEEGLAGVEVPTMFMAGSVDDVSGYEDGTRAVFEGLSSTERLLVTFENANHNAAAPIPAPREVFERGEGFDHYSDPVWDTVRMNNIAQHFVAAFLASELKGESEMRDYLEPGEFRGFPDRTTAGLQLDYRAAGE